MRNDAVSVVFIYLDAAWMLHSSATSVKFDAHFILLSAVGIAAREWFQAPSFCCFVL